MSAPSAAASGSVQSGWGAVSRGHGGRNPGWGPERDRRDDRQRHHRRGKKHGFYAYGGISGYGDYGHTRESFFRGDGFVEVAGGQPRYDYDRGYPYDFYSGGGGYEEEDGYRQPRESRCDMEWTRGRDGREVAVRVCRN
jgi:hypothetical protein